VDFAALVNMRDAESWKFETGESLTLYLPAEKLNPDRPSLQGGQALPAERLPTTQAEK
jgi:hypothetical protein